VKSDLQRRLERTQPDGGVDAVEAGHIHVQHRAVEAAYVGNLHGVGAVLGLDYRRNAGVARSSVASIVRTPRSSSANSTRAPMAATSAGTSGRIGAPLEGCRQTAARGPRRLWAHDPIWLTYFVVLSSRRRRNGVKP
jgi:hypothetical protein